MKYILLLFMVLLSACSTNQNLKETDKYTNHQIIGSWVLNKNGCDERYEFLASGTREVTSNQEKVKAKYEIKTLSEERGIYLLQDEVIEDNGKPDCSGSTKDMTGDVVVVLLHIQDNPKRFNFCFDKELTRCVGPFIKNP